MRPEDKQAKVTAISCESYLVGYLLLSLVEGGEGPGEGGHVQVGGLQGHVPDQGGGTPFT